MTEALFANGAQPKKVLEVGTGSGYQAAILAALGLEVHTVERIVELLRTARKRFRTLGFNIRSKHDDRRIVLPEYVLIGISHVLTPVSFSLLFFLLLLLFFFF